MKCSGTARRAETKKLALASVKQNLKQRLSWKRALRRREREGDGAGRRAKFKMRSLLVLLLPEPEAPRPVSYLSVGSDFEAGGQSMVQSKDFVQH